MATRGIVAKVSLLILSNSLFIELLKVWIFLRVYPIFSSNTITHFLFLMCSKLRKLCSTLLLGWPFFSLHDLDLFTVSCSWCTCIMLTDNEWIFFLLHYGFIKYILLKTFTCVCLYLKFVTVCLLYASKDIMTRKIFTMEIFKS